MKKNLNNIFKNYGFYLFPMIIILVMVVLLVKVDMPKIREINTVRRQLSGIQERLARLGAKSSLLSSLDEGKLKQDIERTSLVLPDGKDAPGILRTLENSASSSGVLLEDLDLAPGKIATYEATPLTGKENQNEIPLKVTVSGTTPQIIAYLEKTASVGRAIGVQDLEVDFTQGSASAKASLKLVAYFLSATETKTAVEEALPTLGVQENGALSKIYSREILVPLPITPGTGKTDLFK